VVLIRAGKELQIRVAFLGGDDIRRCGRHNGGCDRSWAKSAGGVQGIERRSPTRRQLWAGVGGSGCGGGRIHGYGGRDDEGAGHQGRRDRWGQLEAPKPLVDEVHRDRELVPVEPLVEVLVREHPDVAKVRHGQPRASEQLPRLIAANQNSRHGLHARCRWGAPVLR
jgi:hypothetical protein